MKALKQRRRQINPGEVWEVGCWGEMNAVWHYQIVSVVFYGDARYIVTAKQDKETGTLFFMAFDEDFREQLADEIRRPFYLFQKTRRKPFIVLPASSPA